MKTKLQQFFEWCSNHIQDKALHAEFGSLIYLILFVIFILTSGNITLYFPVITAITLAITFVAGIAKEHISYSTKGIPWDFNDILATTFGGVQVAVIMIITRLIFGV